MAPETSRLQIVERRVNDVTILHLTGEITLDDGDLAYGRAINQLMESNQTRILVDLSEVTRIDSSGIGMMAAKVKACAREGRRRPADAPDPSHAASGGDAEADDGV